MTTQPHRRRIRLFAGVLGTLAAGLLFAPAARASCGDYVMIGHPNTAAGISHRQAKPEPTSPEHAASRHGQRPCSGPRCSGAPPAAPVTPAAPPAPARGEDCDRTSLSPVDTDDAAAGLACDEPRPRPVRRGPAIYHPPR